MPVKLETVTSRIFQGIKTSADSIYIVEERVRETDRIKIYSPHNTEMYWVEPELFHPLVKSGDSKRYSLTKTNRLILFPYMAKEGERASLIDEATLKTRYPLTWAYLKAHRKPLENRERGQLQDRNWYRYSRNQALDVIGLPKIFTPDIAARASYSLDVTGDYFFTGGTAGGYGILVLPDYSRSYILALLNSKLLQWFIHQTSSPMRGGYFSYESRYIKHLPIHTIDMKNRAERTAHDEIVTLVDQMLDLHRQRAAARTPHDIEHLERQIASFDAQIDQHVYRLYDVSAEEIALIEAS